MIDADTMPAPRRCELCGAHISAAGSDRAPMADAAEALRRVADIWAQDRTAAEIILCRVLFPNMAYRSMGRMCGGISAKTIVKKLGQILETFPMIGDCCKDKSAYAEAQKRRRG